MRPTGKTEEFVYQAVLSGAMEIRPDGSVWRVMEERRNRWNDRVKFVKVTPHRIDNSPVPGYYRYVKVMRQGKQVTVVAHRLVWRHFNGPIPNGLTINHENGIKDDNRPENLEPATYSGQQVHATHILKTSHAANQNGEKNYMAKLTEEQVIEIRKRRANGEALLSIAADFGVGFKAISKIARRQRWIS